MCQWLLLNGIDPPESTFVVSIPLSSIEYDETKYSSFPVRFDYDDRVENRL
jgi:hypothetical protein